MNTFHEMKKECTRPSMEAMRRVLDSRERVAPNEADYFTYLAAYTHFSEAQSILGEYGHFLDERPVFFLDHGTGKVHAKILMLAMKNGSLGWRARGIARQKHKRRFINEIELRNHEGNFLGTDWIPSGIKFWEFQEYVATLDLGIYEEVTQRTRNLGQRSDKRFVCHLADSPANYGVNLSRMFSNVSAVVMAPNRDDCMNVAFWRLEEASEAIHEHMRSAQWFILETSAEDLAMKLLDRLGAKSTILKRDSGESMGPELIDVIVDQLAEQVANANEF